MYVTGRRLIVGGMLGLSVALSACIPGVWPPPSGSSSEAGEPEATGDGGGSSGELAFVDQDLVVADLLSLHDKRFRLNGDGTVSGDKEVLLYMSKATHWRYENGTLDLCTSKECEYWSAWKVEPTEENALLRGDTYLFTLQGAKKEDTGEAVTREIVVAK